MKSKIELANILLCVVLAAPVMYAYADKPEGKRDKASRQQTVQVEDRMQKRDEIRERAEREREPAEDRAERERDMAEERAESAREEAEAMSKRDREASIERSRDLTGRENAASRGNETSQEMRARRDERKAIKDEYAAGRESGDEGIDSKENLEEQAAGQQKKAKKPWWKFWGD